MNFSAKHWLLDIFYQTRRRFYSLDLDVYTDACSEIDRLAHLLGTCNHEMAKILISGKED